MLKISVGLKSAELTPSSFPYPSSPSLVVFSRQKMKGHLRLLNIACAAKAKWRQITLQKTSRESPLHFSLQGGSERGFGIFVETVENGSKAAEAGLKRGDQVRNCSGSSARQGGQTHPRFTHILLLFQIMEINGQNLENISISKAVDILRNNTHLSLTVKTNIFGQQRRRSPCTSCTKAATAAVKLIFLLSSLQRAPQQGGAREEERWPPHPQDPGEEGQPLLHPGPPWRHGVLHRPQEQQETEGQYGVRRPQQDQKDAGEDAL